MRDFQVVFYFGALRFVYVVKARDPIKAFQESEQLMVLAQGLTCDDADRVVVCVV